MELFRPSQIDFERVKQALAEGKLDGRIHDKIMGRNGMVLQEASVVATDAGLPHYPHIRLLPGALLDAKYHAVNAGSGIPVIEGGNFYLGVQISGPYLIFIDRFQLRGILGHELVHYIKDTIDLHKFEGQERFVLHRPEGIDLDKLSNEERPALVYDSPEKWFTEGGEVLKAVKSADSKFGKPRKVSDYVLDLVQRGMVPIHDFDRGGLLQTEGKLDVQYTDVGQAVLSIAVKNGIIPS